MAAPTTAATAHPGDARSAPPEGAVVAVVSRDVLSALSAARALSVEARTLLPDGSSWTADDLTAALRHARISGGGDLILCGAEWLAGQQTARLLKPIEERAGQHRWLLPVSDVDRLPTPLRSRIEHVHQHRIRPGEPADLLESLHSAEQHDPAWKLSGAQLRALSALSEPIFREVEAATWAKTRSEAISALQEAPAARAAGGRPALIDAVASRAEHQLADALRHRAASWADVSTAAAHTQALRRAAQWNTPLTPALTLVHASVNAATRTAGSA